MNDPCSVCGSPARACYETHLCMTHVVEANRARDTLGFSALWPDVVRFVHEWARKQRKPESEAKHVG